MAAAALAPASRAAAALASFGYAYVPGDGGADASDLVLRQTGDLGKGFEWRGQADYDEVAAAVVEVAQAQLQALCGLERLALPPDASLPAVVWATPGFRHHTGPLVLLVCGAGPGGHAGVWGRSLCINASTREGAMFDYIFRAQRLGWAVVVANPNVNVHDSESDQRTTPIPGSECPQRHLQTLWTTYVEPAAASCVLAVAHSYGGANMVHLLKTEATARTRIQAIAFTDGTALTGTMLQEALLTAEEVAAHPKPAQAEELRVLLQGFQAAAPAAFAAPPAEVLARLAAVGRNFVSSELPLGTPVEAEHQGVPTVSAGHTSHPSTTHAATEEVFAFLQRGVCGGAGEANDELRAAF